MSALPVRIAVDFSQAPEPIDQFVDAVFGDGVGYVAVSYGRTPSTPTFYPWPADKERLLADVERRQAKDNVFFCPALRANEGALRLPENCAEGETPSLPVEPMPCLWADVDLVSKDGTPKSVNVELLNALGGIQVRSGTPGHIHWYGPLMEGVGLPEFDRLNPEVKNALGADAKQANVSWLRWPTSINHKPTARMVSHSGRSSQGRVRLPEDLDVEPIATRDLEALIASHVSPTGATKQRLGTRAPGRQRATEARAVRLLRRYANEVGDRSDQFHAVVLAGVEDGVSLDRLEELLTGHVVAERFERKGRLARMIEKSAKKAKIRGAEAVTSVRQTSWTLDALMAEEFPDLSWAVGEFIPEGLTLLVSAPKIGKSYLTMNLALSLIYDEVALGSLDVEAGEVLVIPLDDPSPRRMQQRLEQIMGAMTPKGRRKYELHLELDWPTLAEGGGEQLDEWLAEHPNCRMVVIDTLSRLRDEESRKSSDPGKPDEKAMAKFKSIADKHRVAIVGTHHDKKGESDDFVDMVSGNKKLTGGADTIIYLKRVRGQGYTIAKITGRDVEERELALRFDHPLWVVSDHTPAELGMSDIRLKIVKYIREHGSATISKLATDLGEPYTTVQQRVFTMKKAGELVQPRGDRTPYELPRA